MPNNFPSSGESLEALQIWVALLVDRETLLDDAIVAR